jgi:hypothetical protein
VENKSQELLSVVEFLVTPLLYVGGMSSLHSVLDEMRLVEPDEMTISELGDEILELTRVKARLEAVQLARLASFERRGGYETEGYLSATAWLKHKARLVGGVASGMVRTARALVDMPVTRAAFLDGDIAYSSIRLLVDSYRAHPSMFTEHETALVDAARSLEARPFRTAVGYWRQALDYDTALSDANHQYEARSLHISDTFGGMVRADGDFDPEGGQVVKTAVGSLTDEESKSGVDDQRTPAQRRADALVEICRHWLDSGSGGDAGGEKPHLSVVVDVEVLEQRAPGQSQFLTGEAIHPETARRLACDAGVSRIITKGGSEPLDVGRRTRTVPTAMRRAVVLRDRCCTFPGCDRPPRWCDAHHMRHWADGGTTAIHNLTLLCRRHHRLIHEGGWSIEIGPEGLLFVDPEGRARSP